MRIILVIAIIITAATAISSCHFQFDHSRDNNISISVTESDHSYNMYAKFDKRKTREVMEYINEYGGGNGIFHSDNVDIDACTYLEDDTRVYVYAHPGKLKIEFNKDNNSRSSYEKVKEMCEGIKDILGKNDEK